MKQAITAKSRAQSNKINRYAYILYMVLVVYLVCKGDYDWALTNMGVALVFDPFEVSVKWQDRSRFQRAWLMIHITLMIGGFAWLLLIK